ncbi:tetraspanin-12-like [Solanum stenotomum]|uniref:tetraspanin-12-like n=1 Tax=Solanum stenotomum TaxID=172797 RepID=UPI0020D06C2F|nr:tetraspanin-12-like [Solanum stenotomum]
MSGVSIKQILCIFIYGVFVASSLAEIGFSIWLHFSDSATLCQKVWQKPLLILGLFTLVVSALILVDLFCRSGTFISRICSISLYLIILGQFCLSLFVVLVTNRNASRILFGRDGNYSHYLLNKYVLNTENWEPIKRCLVDCKFCEPPTETDSYYKYIFPVTQSSCCKPPTYCGLEFHNATYWTMPKTGPAVADNDCKIWSNVQRELCFNCQSCTTAFVDHIQEDWKMYSLIYFMHSVTLTGPVLKALIDGLESIHYISQYISSNLITRSFSVFGEFNDLVAFDISNNVPLLASLRMKFAASPTIHI